MTQTVGRHRAPGQTWRERRKMRALRKQERDEALMAIQAAIDTKTDLFRMGHDSTSPEWREADAYQRKYEMIAFGRELGEQR